MNVNPHTSPVSSPPINHRLIGEEEKPLFYIYFIFFEFFPSSLNLYLWRVKAFGFWTLKGLFALYCH